MSLKETSGNRYSGNYVAAGSFFPLPKINPKRFEQLREEKAERPLIKSGRPKFTNGTCHCPARITGIYGRRMTTWPSKLPSFRNEQ